jgi:hypothetical protein
MNIIKLLEKSHYEKEHKCKTPDAIYSSDISPEEISMKVKLPIKLSLNKDESEELEAKLHYAIEDVLAPYFK